MSEDWLRHHSRLPQYRSPFGAVPCGTGVDLSLEVNESHPVDAVYLRTWHPGTGEELLPMKPAGQRDGSIRYGATCTVPGEPGLVWYYFMIHSQGVISYYGNNREETGGLGVSSASPPPPFRLLSIFRIRPCPAGFKNAVVYQIFVERFCNGNAGGAIDNCKKGSLIHPYWDDDPIYVRDRKTGRILAFDFFGGNLAGVMDKLPYLKSLGVSAIYFNPLFDASSNHKYDTADYKTIDPMFGNELIFTNCAQRPAKWASPSSLTVFSTIRAATASISTKKEAIREQVPGSRRNTILSVVQLKQYPDEYKSWWGVDLARRSTRWNPPTVILSSTVRTVF